MVDLVKATAITNKYIEELKQRGREFHPIRVELMPRVSVHTYGQAVLSYKANGYDVLRINKNIKYDSDLHNIILHELAHLDLYAYGDGHSRKWKDLATYYGRLYGVSITTTSTRELDGPSLINVEIYWTEKCQKLNPHIIPGKRYIRTFANSNNINKYIDKYSKYGLIAGYAIVGGNK